MRGKSRILAPSRPASAGLPFSPMADGTVSASRRGAVMVAGSGDAVPPGDAPLPGNSQPPGDNPDPSLPRLAAVIERQRRELVLARADAQAAEVAAMARGVLMERQGVSAGAGARHAADMAAV